ncbi:MAG: hypothetical protein JW984_15780 [Deltaproteobacteria bacterium]|uniref:SCP2 domain-containing protein n=1 Tax=Candidatus Zymogenus saltonus TaxID=2844893 RepID=A0A9D8KHM0_9DELT|nr:hypothetical protein [Candidatus Zymogenus saltonus]
MSENLVKARLFLYAILPLFEEIAKKDKDAKKILKGLNGVIQFSAPEDLAAQVEFVNDGIVVTPGKEKKSTVSLVFISHKVVSNMLAKKGFGIPLPVKGLLKLGLTKKFEKIGDILDNYMNEKNPKGEEKDLIATLLLYAAVMGAAQVGQADKSMADVVKKIPDGIAHVEIKDGANSGPSVYIVKKGKDFKAVKGRPDDYNAYLGFKNFDIAYAMFTNQLDLMAAVALGDIELSGSLAIIEQLAFLMEKAGAYLE